MAKPSDRGRVPAEVLAELRELLGEDALLTDPARIRPYQTDAMPLHRGDPGIVLMPATPEQAAEVVRILHRAALAWVPRGRAPA